MLEPRKFFPYRFGSDPEFLFAKTVEWSTVKMPAASIISKNKSRTLKSFIGTDAHTEGGAGVVATTAELRPAPSFNIRRHLYDIAVAIDVTAKYLAEKHPGVFMAAKPILCDETLGGHIHMSFFMNDARAFDYERRNLSFISGQFNTRWKKEGSHNDINFGNLNLDNETRDCLNHAVFTPAQWLYAMTYLLMPFENWIQPWFSREARNLKYGNLNNEDTMVRLQPSPRPEVVGERFKKMAWFHLEYRSPSTWMVHPVLASAYFGLTKLIALNWDKVAPVVEKLSHNNLMYPFSEPKKKQAPITANASMPVPTAHNEKWRVLFFDRLASLGDNLVFTPDIRNLGAILESCSRRRPTWWEGDAQVDVEAWRKLLV